MIWCEDIELYSKDCDFRIMRNDFITDFSPIDRDLNFELRI
jgi:hypothetical protein